MSGHEQNQNLLPFPLQFRQQPMLQQREQHCITARTICRVHAAAGFGLWSRSLNHILTTLFPFPLCPQPMLQQRERYIKCFLWAMPEKAQHIGSMVALGVDATNWHRISSDLPEIIPRGAAGWTRYG